MFHSQMQKQECKTEAIKKKLRAVGKMMKKLLHEKHKKEKGEMEAIDEEEKEDSARAGAGCFEW